MMLTKAVRGSVVAAGLSLGMLFTAPVQAHPLWILPSEFNSSTEEAEWLTFDVSASHTVFGFDKGVPLNTIRVISPDGDRNYLGSYFKGHRRSVFDYKFDQDGTYRVQGQRPPFFFTSYKSGKRDTPKRMMADSQEAKQRLPKNARDVKTMLIDVTSTVYVTRNGPTDVVFQPKGKGFELTPITHPNDIAQNELTSFEVLLDGQPVAGAEVEVTPGGTRYRNARNSIELVTDETGRIEFTPAQAGPWLMSATLTAVDESPLADEKISTRFLTFEVIAE